MDHVKAAEKYLAGHKPDGVHPDVAAAMHRFENAEGDVARAAHAEALTGMVELLGDAASVAPEADPRLSFVEGQRASAKRPAAKKAPAKKAAAKRSRSRS